MLHALQRLLCCITSGLTLLVIIPSALATPSPASKVSISRPEGSPEIVDEGGVMSITIDVVNARDGQTFDLWHANSVDGADFEAQLDVDIKRTNLPPGVTSTPAGPLKSTIRLASGSYSFTVQRRVSADQLVESMDQAPWAAGNQEQTDVFIGNPQGGLEIAANVLSNWIGDVGADDPRTRIAASIPANSAPKAIDAPPAKLPATVAIGRTPGSTQIVLEGMTLSFVIQVRNASKGQTFHLWHANTMNAADFANPLIADVSAGAPPGVIVKAVSPTRVSITLPDGDVSFEVKRPTTLDGANEATDQAPWMVGNQEQTDLFLSDPTSGLRIEAYVISSWVTDTARTTELKQ